MSDLIREEIVLLDCFNYLNIGDQNDRKLGEVVNDIFNIPNRFQKLTADKPAAMGAENWKDVLERIKNNEKLCSLTIKKQSQVMGYDTKGLNAVCFLDEQSNKATFVFRGTGSGEWLDNGLAFAENDSPQQLEALQYFNRSVKELKLQENGYIIDVTGHSKGGNKAQFVTINADIVNKGYSFDGQGFSKEALEKYREKIEQNSHKITSIAAESDYIHCLGNEIAVEKELFKSNYEFKYFSNHCPDAILNQNGGLTAKVQWEPWQNVVINKYSRYLMELNPDMKKEVFTSFMGLFQMSLGKDTPIANRIPSYENAKIALSEASVEFKEWFKQERNQFAFGQKVALVALGAPIIRLALPLVYKAKYKSFQKMEEQILGTLKNDINKEFSASKDVMKLEKVLDHSKEDLEKVHKFMENKFSGLRKEAKVEADNKLDQGMIKLQGEKDILKTAKEKLEILDKYKPIVATYNSKKLFKKSYKNKHAAEIQEYNQAKKELESMKIKNWDDFKEAKAVLDKKEKSLVGDKKLPSLKDYKKDIEELRKNKNIQNDIIKEHSNLVKVKLQKLDNGIER